MLKATLRSWTDPSAAMAPTSWLDRWVRATERSEPALSGQASQHTDCARQFRQLWSGIALERYIETAERVDAVSSSCRADGRGQIASGGAHTLCARFSFRRPATKSRSTRQGRANPPGVIDDKPAMPTTVAPTTTPNHSPSKISPLLSGMRIQRIEK